MTDSRAAVGLDRLPWLADEPVRRAPAIAARRELIGWIVAAVLLVAIGSYWIGTRVGHGGTQDRSLDAASGPTPSNTVNLPPPRAPAEPQPEVRIEPVPEVQPTQSPSVAVSRPPIEAPTIRRAIERSREKVASADESTTAAAPAPAPTSSAPTPPAAASRRPVTAARPLTLWPVRTLQGAYGRIVRVGAFGSRYQAKLGWRYMIRSYPAVGRLPAVVVATRNSRGRVFYRFQIGTTSQAHSEVLCQRMETIRLSCAVVGLPWKPQGVER